jgi:hypothetical protein
MIFSSPSKPTSCKARGTPKVLKSASRQSPRSAVSSARRKSLNAFAMVGSDQRVSMQTACCAELMGLLYFITAGDMMQDVTPGMTLSECIFHEHDYGAYHDRHRKSTVRESCGSRRGE